LRIKIYCILYLYTMSSPIRIYVDFGESNDKTHLFKIKEGTTTFRDIENQFLEIPEFDGKQIYGMYNDARPRDFEKQDLSTPPRSLESPLDTSILIITNLRGLNPNGVKRYNMYNTGQLGFKYAQRNSKEKVRSTKYPFYKFKYTYEKSPNIEVMDDETDYNDPFHRPTAPPAPPSLASLYRLPAQSSFAQSSSAQSSSDLPSAPSFDRPSTSDDTITKEEIDIIITATHNNFDDFQICLANVLSGDTTCLLEHENIETKLLNKLLQHINAEDDLHRIITEGRSIEGVIAILNSQKKGGRRKSHKKPRRKSFRQKKRRSTHHKKNVSRR